MRKKVWVVMALAALAAASLVMAAELKVEDAAICKAVVDRAPQEAGVSFPADVGKLYCFTKIVGGAEGTVIKHVWSFGDQEMAAVELKVGAATWRTWSAKTIDPSQKGAWKVEVKDAEGKVLSTLNFTIK